MRYLLALSLVLPAIAEVHTMTLRQALDTALKRNTDVLLARFDEQKATEQVNAARDPFTPKAIVGSGLAYTTGFPMSVEGSAPAIVQAKVIQSIYNKPKSYEVAAARENVRGASIDTSARRDEAAYRTAVLFLSAERAARSLELAKQQIAAFERIRETLQARVAEGRDLPIELRRAQLKLAQAKQRVRVLETERGQAQNSLAVVLGFPAEDQVRPAAEERPAVELPANEVEGIAAALANSKEVKRLESAMQAKGLESRSARAARMPQIDLVAQYALFGKFNNYEDYFRRFERHNGQVGASIALPIFAGSGAKARAVQADLDVERLRTQANATRDRIALDTKKAWADLKTYESASELAKLDLDVSREQLSVTLAQYEEGRLPLRQVEEARTFESEKWLAFYDARHGVERAKIELLRHTGTLLAALR